ncbi:putative sporulation protein YtxC [Niallia circulans]|uniref:sporulation protein YtxC n=1 Tax=Niallia circulans TaxID=1397 RepID=UPI00148FD71E|nr:sporulation protein YtxC [Niallia circulans]QJX63368.1 putative sporulation protein YtxC [Niallia circulans]
MIEIQFHDQKDALRFLRILKKQVKYAESFDRMDDDNKCIIVKTDGSSKEIKKCLTAFILHIKTDDWAREILKNRYFYMDELEQRSILEILHSLVEEEREGLTTLTKEINIKSCLKECMNNFIIEQHKEFSFDSFVTFRLKSFIGKLIKYIELSIDEYKMEQEYQVFIHTLRNSLSKKAAKVNHIHVLIDLEIQFFDTEYREIPQQELMMLYDQKNVVSSTHYIDPYSLGPLLALAPKTIFLYTEDRELPIVRTIVNIFEERVQLLEKEQFFLRISTQTEMK